MATSKISDQLSVFIGYDPREPEAYAVAAYSLQRHARQRLNIIPLKLVELRNKGLYTRPTSTRDGRMWDDLSDAPMSTEFAISRFLLAELATTPWALFCDCDFLWRGDVFELLALADPSRALWCVQHNHQPTEATKMDNQAQLRYARKNWSSMMLWQVRHPAHQRLTLEQINTLPGRDLHRFCWLNDDEIGALPTVWNWLEGSSDASLDPKVVHYTRGGPWFAEWQHVAYAADWLAEHARLKRDEASAMAW